MSALPVPMDKAEAERVTQRIRLLLDSIANNAEKVLDLIEQAKAADAWKPLGYDSWTDYVAAEFGEALARLNRGDRLQAVVKMRELGMSTRAIGEVVGTDHATVVRDLKKSGGADAPPEQAVTGRDGKTYPRPAMLLPSGKPDAASTEAIGKAAPAVKVPRPVSLAKLIARIIRDLDALADRLADMDDDQREQYGEELAELASSAEAVNDA